MKKKILSIALAGAMAASMVTVGTVAASADEKAVGGFGTLGEYTPSDPNMKTSHLMFAMPGAWQNDTTKDPKCGGAAGIYWWSGFDTPDSKAGGHGWPGYKSVLVTDEKQPDVKNLYAIDVPIYGNGDAGNANMIIWDNYIDGGTEEDTSKNPYYSAAKQTKDFQAAPVSRFDKNKTYDEVFRYAYKTIFVNAEIEGADALDLKSDTFWEDINKISATHLGNDWDKLSADDKDLQANDVITEIEEDGLDLSFFGDYAENFFNEDTVDEMYPAEDPQYYSLTFTYDNMVFVLNFDPDKMVPSPTSGMIGYDGNFFFQYGNGLFGNWPTKELLESQTGITFDAEGNAVVPEGDKYVIDDYGMVFMKDANGNKVMVAGNFAGTGYTEGKVVEPTVATTAATESASTVPSAATDATSATSTPSSGSTTANNSNGAIATGQVSFVVIVLTVLIAGVGIVYFTRKKSRK